MLVLLLFFLLIPDQHLAFVRNENGLGSGVIIKDGYVLTAEHLYSKNGVYVNHAQFDYLDGRKKAEVINRDKDNDLMLLRANVKGSVKFADPKLDEEVIIVGYAFGIKMVFHGRVSAIENNVVFIDCNAMRGTSGAGVFNKNGKLIGMVSFVYSDGGKAIIGAIHSEIIQKFIGDLGGK